MIQVIMALAIVATLVYFVLFRTSTNTESESPRPYAAEVEKAEQVEDSLLQTQQLQNQRIESESQ
jgi:hypothetical protein